MGTVKVWPAVALGLVLGVSVSVLPLWPLLFPLAVLLAWGVASVFRDGHLLKPAVEEPGAPPALRDETLTHALERLLPH